MFAGLTLLTASALFAQDAPSSGASPDWEKMPILPPEAAEAGVFPGGEGSQWPRWGVVVSPADPDFLLLPIDVGGLYRSLDGGKNWLTAMTGWNARGANHFAIDPKNANRVIGVGGNSSNWNAQWGASPHGLYLSTDKAATWRQTLGVLDGLMGFVTFDPSSYDEKLGYCTVAYYSAPLSGLFRTEDGGSTWKFVSRLAADEIYPPGDPASQNVTAALLAVDPADGTLYLAGRNGLHRSKDRGATFERIWKDGAVWGLSLSPAQPEKIWISGDKGLFVSEDRGKTFSALPAGGVAWNDKEPIRQVTVSPLQPERMFVWVAGANWNWVRYLSEDAGQTFVPIKVDVGLSNRVDGANAQAGGFAVMPYNVRNGYFTFHPTDSNVVYGLGGDWVTRSTDGGKTFHWWNNGYNGIMLGRSLNFSAHAPDVVFLAFQDYNGAYTLDGGKTWNYRDISGLGWGGHAYGGHAVNADIMWYGDAEGWGTPRRLRISRDGGKTWNFVNGPDGKPLRWTGADVSSSDPTDPNVLFASNWRSTDQGKTWEAMSGCDGVYVALPGHLVGRKGRDLVISRDKGASWEKIVTVPGGFMDAAYDPKRDRYYVVSEERLKQVDKGVITTLETPADQYGKTRFETVAVDPVEPDVVYAGGPRNLYATHATVVRSTDAGATWENLTVGNGPHEVAAIRVNPKTRDVWLNGQCYGMWRLAPPEKLGPAADPKNAARAPSVPFARPVPVLGRLSSPARDFGDANFDYPYGSDWKLGQNVKPGRDGATGYVELDTTENGGAGLVLNGASLVPHGETHFGIRLRVLPGNRAGSITAKVMRGGEHGGTKEFSFGLGGIRPGEWVTLKQQLGDGDFTKVDQIQVQGNQFDSGAAPLKIQIDEIGTTKP